MSRGADKIAAKMAGEENSDVENKTIDKLEAVRDLKMDLRRKIQRNFISPF